MRCTQLAQDWHEVYPASPACTPFALRVPISMLKIEKGYSLAASHAMPCVPVELFACGMQLAVQVDRGRETACLAPSGSSGSHSVSIGFFSSKSVMTLTAVMSMRRDIDLGQNLSCFTWR